MLGAYHTGCKIGAGAPLTTRVEPSGVQHVWNVVVEREGGDKPVLVAEWILRSY